MENIMNNADNNHKILSAVETAAQQIRDLIKNEKFAFGKKLPPERKLAEKFKVSRATVQKALDILEDQRLVKRYQGRGTFTSDATQIQNEPPSPRLLGAMTFERKYYFEPVLQAASKYASEHGYVLAIANNSNPKMEIKHINSFINNGIKGIFFTPRTNTDPSIYQELAKSAKVVLIDNLHKDITFDSILVDNISGTYLACKHLFELGHKTISYIDSNNDQDYPISDHRKQGYLDACIDFRIQPQVINYNKKEFHSSAKKMLTHSNRPTASICYNDALAVKLIDIASGIGISTPRHLSVIGFDDSKLAKYGKTKLTTINPEHQEMGILAVQQLIDLIETPRSRPISKTFITPKLIIRESTCPPKP